MSACNFVFAVVTLCLRHRNCAAQRVALGAEPDDSRDTRTHAETAVAPLSQTGVCLLPSVGFPLATQAVTEQPLPPVIHAPSICVCVCVVSALCSRFTPIK